MEHHAAGGWGERPVKLPQSDKVTPEHSFLDLSDYARPFARWLVARLLNTSVQPNHLTLAFTAAGLLAAALLADDRYLPAAAGLLLVKSGLDAADGALARARSRPSRVGRFLDSVLDFVVNVAVYFAIGAAAAWQTGQDAYWALAAFALVSGLLQVSLFNHFYVRYRAQTGGDQTSQVQETEAGGYPWDNPTQLRWLHRLYQLIYGWQDALVTRLDRLPGNAQTLTPGFMTATTALGLGTQLLVIAACCLVGQPVWALWLLATVFNVYALLLTLYRHRPRA